MLVAIHLVLTPFIQLGTSYYVSVYSAMAVSLVVLRFSQFLPSSLSELFPAVVVPLMFVSLSTGVGEDPVQEYLRVLREGVIWLFLMMALQDTRSFGKINTKIVLYSLALVISGEVVLVLVQIYGYSRGQYFGIPVEYFAVDGETIPDELALYFSKLRPSGTFQEPSYLAFILISLIVAMLPTLRDSSLARIMCGACVITGIFSRSLSFVLALSLISTGYLLQPTGIGIKPKYLIAASGILIVLVAPFVDISSLVDRIASGPDEIGDVSTFSRIFAPVAILPKFLLLFPLGVPFSNLPAAINVLQSPLDLDPLEILQNGILNLFFEFGIIGVVILLFYLSISRQWIIRMYLLASGCFNGALLAPDKFAVIVLTVFLYRSFLSTRAASPKAPLRARLSKSNILLNGVNPRVGLVEERDVGPQKARGGAL